MDDAQFEQFVREWMARVKHTYLGIERFGGPGDMGRDVVGWLTDAKCLGPWDNIQCKRLNDVLAPSILWPELGKVFWHADRGDYVLPKAMKFLCSKGIGTTAKHLLTNGEALRAGLIMNWDKNVAHAITTTQKVELTGSLHKLVTSASFSIFGPMAIEDVLRDLEGTGYYVQTFGGGLPPRPNPAPPPKDIQAHENRYVRQLLAVYAERRGVAAITATELDREPRDRRHFDGCRQQFYSAEALKEFARDVTPQGTFQSFQDDVISAIMPVLDADYRLSFDKLRSALYAAGQMPPASNALYAVATVRDKQGVCHQLANDDQLQWIAQ